LENFVAWNFFKVLPVNSLVTFETIIAIDAVNGCDAIDAKSFHAS